MLNPVNSSSQNFSQFGFTSIFDLLAQNITFDISTLTTFINGGDQNVIGVAFSVIDPSGLELAGIDWSAPQIVPSSGILNCTIDLVNSFAVFGNYTITAIMQDADGTLTQIQLFKQICQPAGFTAANNVPGNFAIKANCDTPIVTFSETTPFVYNGLSPISVTKNGILSYPPGTLNDLPFTSTPFSISGSGLVYTGRYTINNVSVASYDLGDSVTLNISYVTTGQENVVNCNNSLATILCCITNLQDTYNNDPYSVNGKAAKALLDKSSVAVFVALVKEKCGQDNSDDIANIADMLNCDCNCSANAVESQPIVSGGTGVSNINIQGAGANTVSPSTIGATTTYTISAPNINVTNAQSDAAFTIQRIVLNGGTTINYAITLNDVALAGNILDAIQGDSDLTLQLQQIVGAVGGNISLAGLNGGCVISVQNCSYTIIQPGVRFNAVASIVIGGTAYTPDSPISITDTDTLSTWLNGLGLGTFVVSSDPDSGNTIITSTNNPNPVTILNITNKGNVTPFNFTASCISLVQFLNAVISYICALSSLEIEYGVTNDSLCIFNPDGTVGKTPIDPSTNLGTLIMQINAAICVLYNKIAGIALSCANMQALFVPSGAAVGANDGVYGTKANACAKVLYPDLANILLTAIAASPALASQFCAIVASCSGASCSAPSNVSGTLVSGPTCVPVTNVTGSVGA